MSQYIRHEFVVNAEKEPEVAAWIESPQNVGKVGATIVHLLRLHIWAERNISDASLSELVNGVALVSRQLDDVIRKIEQIQNKEN